MNVSFRLNGEDVTATNVTPTTTLLDWLRDTRGLTGTKEGCNEGDCGACSVIVTDAQSAKPLNACILLLPQIAGKAIRTVEGIASPDGTPHPVQTAMIEHHGAQCGFCTPGFITTMAANHLNGATDHDTALAGNLCRCTGYAPIMRAAQAAEKHPVPKHLQDAPLLLDKNTSGGPKAGAEPPNHPTTLDDFADWYARNPQTTLIAGATDVGLWITKQLRDLGQTAFLTHVDGLTGVTKTAPTITIGAMTTLTDLRSAIADDYPQFAELIRRYGSPQVRNAATIGGNIANGSPIGDGPPALIALDATLHLRHGATSRSLPLADFFIDYGQQDLKPGEFVTHITVPRATDALRCYKLSKRFDQDISSVCGCFWIEVEGGHVTTARLAFGGMAGTPKRSPHTEAALVGQPWHKQTVETAMQALAADFTPLSDMRASAEYRLKAAQNMLMRAWLEDQGAEETSVLKVTA